MADAQPETVVIIEPHSLLVEGAISLLDSARVHGSVEEDLPGEPEYGFSLDFAVDQDLNAAIAEAARTEDIPVARVRDFVEAFPLPLYWGSLVPLWFSRSLPHALGRTLCPRSHGPLHRRAQLCGPPGPSSGRCERRQLGPHCCQVVTLQQGDHLRLLSLAEDLAMGAHQAYVRRGAVPRCYHGRMRPGRTVRRAPANLSRRLCALTGIA